MVLLHKRQFCFKRDTHNLIKAILDENMFCIQCSISHQCGCLRQLTYSIGFQDKDGGKEGNIKTGSYVKKDSCVIHDRGHSYSNSFNAVEVLHFTHITQHRLVTHHPLLI
jgi:hypothetical protein